ncbi:hypothetical protein M569_13442 [Genlisea aurea]|uniref:Uncharacterized protein n=1 Tax=Genlisea aurea TaxID=192259 RepID=S8CAI4_9LAMI|nr:hypothetical protein M569_13442 [Genlisea aurea]
MGTAGEDALELSLDLSVGGRYRKRKTEDSSGGPIRRPISRSDCSSPEENGFASFKFDSICRKRNFIEYHSKSDPKIDGKMQHIRCFFFFDISAELKKIICSE